jgi:hypothetical protein
VILQMDVDLLKDIAPHGYSPSTFGSRSLASRNVLNFYISIAVAVTIYFRIVLFLT